jgi:hypothetical protein
MSPGARAEPVLVAYGTTTTGSPTSLISPVANYRGAIDQYILPKLGRVKVQQVDASTIDALYEHAAACGEQGSKAPWVMGDAGAEGWVATATAQRELRVSAACIPLPRLPRRAPTRKSVDTSSQVRSLLG